MGDLASIARSIFVETLELLRADRAVAAALRRDGDQVDVGNVRLNLGEYRRCTVISIGKAAAAMSRGLGEILGDRIDRGLCITNAAGDVPSGFELIVAGHPTPTAESVRGAERAFELLDESDREDALVWFLVSGGGSALCEYPAFDEIDLAALQEVNRTLVGCGAVIADINAIRRRLSAVKGGGLARRARRATQCSLYVSDVNPGDLAAIASGPTLPDAVNDGRIREILARHDLERRLSDTVTRLLRVSSERGAPPARSAHVLVLDNQVAVETAASIARDRHGLTVAIDPRHAEEPVADCATGILATARKLSATHPGHTVCSVSGGEVVCPVVGSGRGGRNQELALRAALALEGTADEIAILSAGTDGQDGNSPAAGAVVDASTCERARAAGLDPLRQLQDSDSFPLFDRIGGAIVTGPTGNNVRDLRFAVARR